MRGATRRRHTDSQLLMLQNPHRHQCRARCRGREGQAGAPVGVGNPATAHTEGATTKQISPNKNHAVPLRYKTLPARPPLPHFRYKTLPARAARPHFRYKTLPARPPLPHFRYKTLPARAARPHFRYKTLPAHPKWLNLAQSTHAGRVLYRSHHQEAEQGEFCTEREAEIERANTTGHHAPPVWRVPKGPERRAPEKPEGTGGLRGAGPDYTPRGP